MWFCVFGLILLYNVCCCVYFSDSKKIFLPDSGRQGGRFCKSLAKSPSVAGIVGPYLSAISMFFYICFWYLCCFLCLLKADVASHWQNWSSWRWLKGRICQSLPKFITRGEAILPVAGKIALSQGTHFASGWQIRLLFSCFFYYFWYCYCFFVLRDICNARYNVGV